MKETPITEALARRYLLGDVNDQDRESVERQFISDSAAKDIVLLAEEDLIEQYLEGRLPQSDRTAFLERYTQTARQRRRLRIANSIRAFAFEHSRSAAPPPAISRWRALISSLKPRNAMILLPVTALVLIAIVVGIFWLRQFSESRLRQSDQRVAIERELAELNAGNQTVAEAHIQSLVLPPVSVRSASSGNELTLQPETRLVELRLLPNQPQQYATFRATVRRVGASDEFTIHNLRVVSDSGVAAIRLRLPAHLLTRGLYQVSVNGTTSDRKSEPVAEYTFSVSK